MLLEAYLVTLSRNDLRFDYLRFCQDLQPMGQGLAVLADELPRDQRCTSPLVVQQLCEEEEHIVTDVSPLLVVLAFEL